MPVAISDRIRNEWLRALRGAFTLEEAKAAWHGTHVGHVLIIGSTRDIDQARTVNPNAVTPRDVRHWFAAHGFDVDVEIRAGHPQVVVTERE